MYIAVAFASPMHGAGYIEGKFRELNAVLPELQGPFYSPDEAPAAAAKVVLVVNLTGGTSRAAVEYAERIGADKIVALGLPEHNSLASALSTKSLFEDGGGRAWVFHCPPGGDCKAVAEAAKAVARAVALLTEPRVLLIGQRTRQAEAFAAKFKAKVDVMSVDDFIRIVEGSPPAPEVEATFGVADDRIAKIHAALKRISAGFDGIAVNCFPFIMKYGATPCLPLSILNASGHAAACEGDLQALAAMLMARGLAGVSGWISNVVYAKPEELYLAHCTISLDMAKSRRIVPHFETGRPYGLAAELAERRYTAISVGPKFDKMAAGIVDVEESGILADWACRTQARARPLFDGRRLLELAPANHHVLVPGDRRGELKAVAHLLSMEYAEY